MKNVLLNGGAGLVGAHLFAALSARADVTRIYFLAASDSGAQTPEAALRRLQHFAGATSAEIKLLPGDARLPRFRLPENVWRELCGEVDVAFDCAETERIDADAEALRRFYVAPVEHWLELLNRNERLRLNRLSTVFVAGTRRGLFTEFDLDCGQDFHNAWERSAFEAERTLRASAASERVTIYRPGHVVGAAQNGSAFAFTNFYPLLRLMREGKLRLVAGDAQARLDVVPADYVARAMTALGDEADARGQTFHLVAGWERSVPVRDFFRLASTHARTRVAETRLAPPIFASLLGGVGQLTRGRFTPASSLFAAYRDYLMPGAVFDDFLARRALAQHALACPPPETYLAGVIEYAEARGWNDGAANDFSERKANGKRRGLASTAAPLNAARRVIPRDSIR